MSVDQQQRRLLMPERLWPESADADAGQRAGVLHDVDAGVFLQDVGKVRADGAFQVDGVDNLRFSEAFPTDAFPPASL
jgi:hypothetical protein